MSLEQSERIVEVQLKDLDAYYLRFLYPEIEVNSIAPIVYSNKNDSSYGYNLTLLESKSGFPIFQKEGVVAFLREMEYMQPSKIDRLEKSDMASVDEVYGSVAMLRVANHMVKNDHTSIGFVTDFLAKPLEERVIFALENGTPELLTGILNALNKALDKEVLKYQHKYYQKKLQELEAAFRKRDFKQDFEITGEWLDDLIHLQYYFRDRS